MPSLEDEPEDYRVDLNWEGGSHTFLLNGGILHHPRFCAPSSEAIGFSIAHWARFETHIDALIFQLNQAKFYPNVNWLTGKHPTNFPDKLDLLKKLFNWHPAISHLYKDITSISIAAKALIDTRNVIVHSVFAGINNSSQSLIFHSFLVNRDGDIKLKITEITFEDMGAFARDINRVNSDLCQISSNIFRTETFHRLQELLPHNPEETL